MIHAKTAVVDGMWARVGSSNMNLASLLGNWEMDVAVLDPGFAAEMEELFVRDMRSSVEITLGKPVHGGFRERRATDRQVVVHPADAAKPGRAEAREARRRAYRGGTVGRAVGRAARAGSVLTRALVGQRMIGREDTGWVAALGMALVLLAVAGFLLPRLIAWPVAFLLFWLGVASLVRGASRPRTPPGGGGPAAPPGKRL